MLLRTATFKTELLKFENRSQVLKAFPIKRDRGFKRAKWKHTRPECGTASKQKRMAASGSLRSRCRVRSYTLEQAWMGQNPIPNASLVAPKQKQKRNTTNCSLQKSKRAFFSKNRSFEAMSVLGRNSAFGRLLYINAKSS